MADPGVYDPATCVTAGGLRERGVAVRPEIPDAAWLPRSAIRMTATEVPSDDGEPVHAVEIEYSEPFRWSEADLVTAGGIRVGKVAGRDPDPLDAGMKRVAQLLRLAGLPAAVVTRFAEAADEQVVWRQPHYGWYGPYLVTWERALTGAELRKAQALLAGVT
jgi:hypothetical protein